MNKISRYQSISCVGGNWVSCCSTNLVEMRSMAQIFGCSSQRCDGRRRRPGVSQKKKENELKQKKLKIKLK